VPEEVKGLKEVQVSRDPRHPGARHVFTFTFTSLTFFTAFVLFISSWIRIPAQSQQQPTFRSRLDLVQLDVSVLDGKRQPIRGLTKDDFVILEDGKPRPIVGFSSYELSEPEAPPEGWMREVAPDVTTNDLQNSRIFVIVIDDALIPQAPAATRDTKRIVESIVNRFAATDLAAIVFSGDNRRSQDFTNDKSKLMAAVEKLNPGLAGYRFGMDTPPPDPSIPARLFPRPVDTDLSFYQSSVRTLENIADYLGAVPDRRKVVFWLSPGVPVDAVGALPKDRYGQPLMPGSRLMCLQGSDEVCLRDAHGVWATIEPPGEMLDLVRRTEAIFLKAQRANVTIYPIDPTGIGGLDAYLSQQLGPQNQGFAKHILTTQQDYLAAAAANTGGRTVMNTNDWEPGLSDVFAENSSYYLLAFEPAVTTADGKLHKIKVEVRRPGAEIRTRTGYWAPRPDPPSSKRSTATPETAELANAVGGLLPSTGLPMQVALTPFAAPGGRRATVAVVLSVRQPIPAGAASSRVVETTELLTSAFTPEGDPRGARRHTARVVLRTNVRGDAVYEVLGRIDLAPGRYRLRLAAHNAARGLTGSVYADVDVPDYEKLQAVLTPVVFGAWPGRVSAPRDLFAGLLPFVPTAERNFHPNDRITALVRLYQSGARPIERADVTIRVRDRDGAVVLSEAQAFAPHQFIGSALRWTDITFDVPALRMAAGPYLLTFDVALGDTSITRHVRFEVR
jgi:VWFA-related protein